MRDHGLAKAALRAWVLHRIEQAGRYSCSETRAYKRTRHHHIPGAVLPRWHRPCTLSFPSTQRSSHQLHSPFLSWLSTRRRPQCCTRSHSRLHHTCHQHHHHHCCCQRHHARDTSSSSDNSTSSSSSSTGESSSTSPHWSSRRTCQLQRHPIIPISRSLACKITRGEFIDLSVLLHSHLTHNWVYKKG